MGIIKTKEGGTQKSRLLRNKGNGVREVTELNNLSFDFLLHW